MSRAYRVNPEINFEVFIHKVDGLSDDHKIETQRDVHQRANDDLADASLEKLHLRLRALHTSLKLCKHSNEASFSHVVLCTFVRLKFWNGQYTALRRSVCMTCVTDFSIKDKTHHNECRPCAVDHLLGLDQLWLFNMKNLREMNSSKCQLIFCGQRRYESHTLAFNHLSARPVLSLTGGKLGMWLNVTQRDQLVFDLTCWERNC